MAYKVYLLESAEQFISDLEDKLKAKSFRTIELLRDFGPELREPIF
jgi:hypothetical protein